METIAVVIGFTVVFIAYMVINAKVRIEELKINKAGSLNEYEVSKPVKLPEPEIQDLYSIADMPDIPIEDNNKL